VIVFKHEALLAFMQRLVRDREFCEWFAAQPVSALASYGLAPRDLSDLVAVLHDARSQREIAAAMEPVVQSMLRIVEDAEGPAPSDSCGRLRLLEEELQGARERVVAARRQRPRPWWQFWG
jgi:hypothetical protein